MCKWTAIILAAPFVIFGVLVVGEVLAGMFLALLMVLFVHPNGG